MVCAECWRRVFVCSDVLCVWLGFVGACELGDVLCRGCCGVVLLGGCGGGWCVGGGVFFFNDAGTAEGWSLAVGGGLPVLCGGVCGGGGWGLVVGGWLWVGGGWCAVGGGRRKEGGGGRWGVEGSGWDGMRSTEYEKEQVVIPFTDRCRVGRMTHEKIKGTHETARNGNDL